MPAQNPPADRDARLAWVVDRIAITDLVSNFAASIDTHDQDGYVANFSEDAVLELPFGRFEGREAIRMMPRGPADWLTQHLMGLPEVHLDGDHATVRAPVQPTHVFGPSDPTNHASAGGFYTFTAERTDEGWRFGSAALTLVWQGAAPMIPEKP